MGHREWLLTFKIDEMNHNEYERDRKDINWKARMALLCCLTLLIIIIGTVSMCHGQDRKSFSIENKGLKKALKEVEEQYHIKFVYSRNRIDVHTIVSIHADSSTIDETLQMFLPRLGIPYYHRGEQYIILQPQKVDKEIYAEEKAVIYESNKVKVTYNQRHFDLPLWPIRSEKKRTGIIDSHEDYAYLKQLFE